MTQFTLRQLRYFEALALHGHFGRAADACAITQPAMSLQIKELETSLGVVLFERGARQVKLTAFGEEFADRVREIVLASEELEEMARASQAGHLGKLRIGVIPTIAPYFLPRLIGDLNTNFDGLDIYVRETLTPKLLEELADGRIDTAIVALPVSEPTFTEVSLFSEEFVLVRPDADKDQPVPSSDKLREMKLLLLEEGHCFRDQALSFCNIQTLRPWEGLDGSSLSTLVQMVGVGLGVKLIPEMAVTVETSGAPVSVSQFDNPRPSRTIGMIWRRTSPLASQLNEVAEVVRTAGKTFRKP
jgi:LysR family hydrogen peroxide-inducible transcriptional activator